MDGKSETIVKRCFYHAFEISLQEIMILKTNPCRQWRRRMIRLEAKHKRLMI